MISSQKEHCPAFLRHTPEAVCGSRSPLSDEYQLSGGRGWKYHSATSDVRRSIYIHGMGSTDMRHYNMVTYIQHRRLVYYYSIELFINVHILLFTFVLMELLFYYCLDFYCLYVCVCVFFSTRARFVIGLWAVKFACKWIELLLLKAGWNQLMILSNDRSLLKPRLSQRWLVRRSASSK
jgi:hypothetical protein